MKKKSLLFVFIFLYSCHSENDIGDAYIIDNGIFEANYRYEIIFKEFLSNIHSNKSYSMNGIPNGNYTVGIKTKRNVHEKLACVLVLRIQDEFGDILLDFENTIKKLTWTIKRQSEDVFGYLDGTSINEHSIYDSYVHLNNDRNYNISFEITPSTCIPENIFLELVLIQRGWK